jgi:flagellar motor switch protein FliG
MATKTLLGIQKAAIVLLQLGSEQSTQLLRSLGDDEVADLMAEVARLRDLDPAVIEEVLEEFTTLAEARVNVTSGGIELARTLLERSLGSDKASEILERVTATIVPAPFEFLRQADPRQVLSFIQDEHPQTICLVIAYCHADNAALIMSGLADERQRDVAHRLAIMDRTSPEMIEEVETVLRKKLSSVLTATEMKTAGGVQALVDILNRSDRTTERGILEGLEHENEALADEVRQRMFVFEDIVGLDDRSVQLILRQVDAKDLAVALKGTANSVKEKITKNMSERASQNLLEELEMLGPVRIKTVEEAQGGIVRVIRALEESGQLVLARSGSDEFVE